MILSGEVRGDMKFTGVEATFFAASRGLKFGFGYAHLWPGAWLRAASPGSSTNFTYLQTDWSFH